MDNSIKSHEVKTGESNFPDGSQSRPSSNSVAGYGSLTTPTGRSWNPLRWFGKPRDGVTAILVFVTLAIVTYSIEQARWVATNPSLTLHLGLSVLATLLLVSRRISAKIAFPLMALFGLGITIWQLSLTDAASSGFASPSWWFALTTPNPGREVARFIIFLLLLTWALGCISAWFALKRDNIWVALGLGVIALVVNLSNLPKQHYYLLLVYVVAGVLLAGITNLQQQQIRFEKFGRSYPKRAILVFTVVLLVMSSVGITAGWFTPKITATQAGNTINAQWSKAFEQSSLNIFATVPAKWRIIKSNDQTEVLFSQSPDESDTVLFVVSSEQPFYWRTRRYDTYNSWGWSNKSVVARAVNPGTKVDDNVFLNRRDITYTVETQSKTDFLLTVGEFVSADIPVYLKTVSSEPVIGTGALDGFLPGGMMLTAALVADQTSGINAVPAPNQGGDIISVTTPQLLKPYQHYSVTASISLANPIELSLAGKQYEPWITDYYLQLPGSLPDRVKRLSRQVTAQAQTPYDKAAAIEAYLHKLAYNLKVKAPPKDRDGVDWFLFQTREGFCTNFASAMVVMLRSVDVPARLATGYTPGEFDSVKETYTVRAKSYHAWPEVYFPDYGWIAFEPTPSSTDTDTLLNPARSTDDSYELYAEEEYGTYSGPQSSTSPLTSSSSSETTRSYLTLLLSVLMMSAVIVFYRRLQQFRGVRSTSDAYAKMCWVASCARVGPQLQETPFEYSSRLSTALPRHAEAIGSITRSYVRTQFSPQKELDVYEKGRLTYSWRTLLVPLVKLAVRWHKPGRKST